MLARIGELFDADLREILSGSLAAMVMQSAGIVFSFLFSLLIARALGPAGAGTFFLGLTIVMMTSVIGRMGLDTAVVRFVARSNSDGDLGRVMSTWRQASLIALTLTAALSLLVWSLRDPLTELVFHDRRVAQLLTLFVLAIVPFALTTVNAAAMKGLKRAAAATFVNNALRWLLALPLLWWSARNFGVFGATANFVAAVVVAWLVSWLMWRRVAPLSAATNGGGYRDLMTTAMPLMWVSSMGMLTRWADTVMIGGWLDSSSVGLYNIAYRVANLISFFLLAVSAVAAPIFAELWHQGKRAELERQSRIAALLIAAIAGPMFVIVVLWPEWLLGFFGDEFADASASLMILAVGQFVNAVTGAVGVILVMTGHEKIMRNIITSAALLNVALNALLIPRFGIDGAATASAITLVLINLASAFFVVRRLDIVPLPFLPRSSAL